MEISYNITKHAEGYTHLVLVLITAFSENNIMQQWHMHKCDTGDSMYTFLLSKENAELCNSIFHKCLFHQVARIS